MTLSLTSLKKQIIHFPETCGIYQMINKNKKPIYIGKSVNIKKRVMSYMIFDKLPQRLKRMIRETFQINFIVTETEVEALLLEAQLIKKWQPPYNILLKDDRLFHFINLSNHKYPQVQQIKASQMKNNFGPFPSRQRANTILKIIQKIFQLRSCNDFTFSKRTKPCILYHIKRCSAPCVNYISNEDYNKQIKVVKKFLLGKHNIVLSDISKKMNQASQNQNYEKAILYRNQIADYRSIITSQKIYTQNIQSADFIAITKKSHFICIQIVFFRNYSHYGEESFFPQYNEEHHNIEDVLRIFLLLFYQKILPPPHIFLSQSFSEINITQLALSSLIKNKVIISVPKQGFKKEIINQTLSKANHTLSYKINKNLDNKEFLLNIKDFFSLKHIPKRIEIYDNSHLFGEFAKTSMVVFTEKGFEKKSYKIYSSNNINKSRNDLNIFSIILKKRFSKTPLPDVVIIDGGKAHVEQVYRLLKYLNLTHIFILGIAKGIKRIQGQENFYIPLKGKIQIPKNTKFHYYLQRLRDEAHRFAHKHHQKSKQLSIKISSLSNIEGIGIKKKMLLLNYFGSTKNIIQSTQKDLLKVQGINKTLAQRICDFYQK